MPPWRLAPWMICWNDDGRRVPPSNRNLPKPRPMPSVTAVHQMQVEGPEKALDEDDFLFILVEL